MIAFLALVGGSMLVKDVFSTANIYFIDRARYWRAGLADGFGDAALLMSAGLGAVEVKHAGLCLESALIVAVLIVGSTAGTRLGAAVAHRLVPKETHDTRSS